MQPAGLKVTQLLKRLFEPAPCWLTFIDLINGVDFLPHLTLICTHTTA